MTYQNKIPRFFFLFSLFTMTVVTSEVLISSELVHYNPNSAYLIPFCLFGIELLLILFLPLKPLNIFVKINKNSFIKLILSVYLLLFIIYSFSLSTLLLHDWFYYETPIYLFLIIFTITVLILSYSTPFLFYFAFFTGLLLLFFNLLPIFNTTSRTFTSILPLNFKINDFFIIFSSLFLVLDLFIFLPFNQNLKIPFKKKHLIITSFLGMLFATFLITDNYLFLFPKLLENSLNPGLIKYKIYTISSYIDNLDSILLFNIFFLLIVKSSLYLNIFRLIHGIKKKFFGFFILGIIIFILSFILTFNNEDMHHTGRNIGYILSSCLIIYYFFLQIITHQKIHPKKVNYGKE